MYYVTPEQEKWLLANGLKPYCPEKGITLLEAIQWFWSNYKVDCSYECLPKGPVCGKFWYFDAHIWECKCHEIFQTIPEALSWAIDQAINHTDNQNNDNV